MPPEINNKPSLPEGEIEKDLTNTGEIEESDRSQKKGKEEVYDPFVGDYKEEEKTVVEEEDVEVDEETEKIVNSRVEKRIAPIEERMKKQELSNRVSSFLSEGNNREIFGDLEGKVFDLLEKNPRVSNLKADALFRLVAADIKTRIGRVQYEADELASQTQIGKSSPRPVDAPQLDAMDMSEEQWKKYKKQKYIEMGMQVF